jgi:hypothetical protein
MGFNISLCRWLLWKFYDFSHYCFLPGLLAFSFNDKFYRIVGMSICNKNETLPLKGVGILD